ncbi:hypothetical protein EI94DRAFT_1447676, partial [Lactarius quietus]
IIRQFDVPKTKKEEALDEAIRELMSLAGNLDDEEHAKREGPEVSDDEDEIKDNNIDGWVDEVGEMSDMEQEELAKDIQPIRWMLIKLRKTAYTIKNSTSIVLDNLSLRSRMMPRDVAMRWNSTYNMLEFSLRYCEALDAITSDKDMKLHKYKMDRDKWEIAHQLCEVLKV